MHYVLDGVVLSIGETDDRNKINLFRNVIKDSFINVDEVETIFGGSKYYIYKLG